MSFEFGEPLDPILPLEEHVEWILEGYDARRYEFVDVSPGQASGLLHRWLSEAVGNDARRVLCIRALGFIRNPASSAHLEPLLNNAESHDVLREAILALARIGRLAIFEKLHPFLKAEDREIRKAAIIALSKSPDRAMFSGFEEAAGADPELKNLVRIGYRRLEALEAKDLRAFTEAVMDSDEYEDLLNVLEGLRKYIVGMVDDHSRSTEVRRRAIELMGAGRVKEASDSFAVIAAAEHQPRILRIWAVWAAGRVRAKVAIPALSGLLDSNDLELVTVSITSLGQIGTDRCISPLLAKWSAWAGVLRPNIRLALRRLATLDGYDVLEAQLRKGGDWRPAAIYFVNDNIQLERRYTEDLLDKALASDLVESRRDAILLLAFLGGQADAAKVQRMQSEDPEPEIRELASLAAGRIGKP